METSMKPIVLILAGGLVASIALHGAFYLLLAVSHAPAAPKPGGTVSMQAWTEMYSSYAKAYTSWQKTFVSYSQAYGLSFLSALGFTVALGVYFAPRLAFVASFSFLNLYFAWTSQLLGYFSAQLQHGMWQAIVAQTSFLWPSANLAYLMPQFIQVGPPYAVAELETLAVLCILMTSSWRLNRHKGAARAVLSSLQVAALSLTILGTEVAMFDSSQFHIYVTQSQELLNFAPSFTNADLLFFAATLLAVSTGILNFRRLWPRRD